MSERTPPRLAGRALKAAVKAAESPMLAAGFKQLMFRQMGIDALMDVEPDPPDTPPWSLPSHDTSARDSGTVLEDD